MEHLFDPEHQFVKLNCSREAAYEKITETVINADLSGKIPADRPFAIRTNINGHEIAEKGTGNHEELYSVFSIKNLNGFFVIFLFGEDFIASDIVNKLVGGMKSFSG